MYRKRILAAAASTAMLTTLFLAGNVLSADRVEVKVTSEPIGSGSSCDKAGGFSLEFDSTTTLLDGDQITIDVDYTNATNYVSLCRDIDIVIAPGADANLTSQEDGGGAAGIGFMDANIPAVGVDSPVVMSANLSAETQEGVIFHVYGNEGSQRITFDVVGIDTAAGAPAANTASITVAGGVNDTLTVRFLDQDVVFAQNGIYVDDTDPADNVYETAATLEDNTLCINVEEWSESTVKGNMDSFADKFTFIPSNPQIAHIVSAAAYVKYECDKNNCGYLGIGATSQAGSNCAAFDNEAPDAINSNYDPCTTLDDHANNQLIIQKTNGVFELVNYIVDVKILVNGVEGDNGVYFTDDAIGTEGAATAAEACAFDNGDGAAIGAAIHYLADGTTATPVAADTDCTIAGSARSVQLTTAGHGLNLQANDDFIYINLPQFHYDLSEVEDGDVVSVEVTLTKAPCGEVTTVTHCIGTFVDNCPTSAGTDALTYPYFTKAATGGDAWWDGLAITNEGSTAGTATITMYENDGDTATATVNVGAHSIYVKTLGAMISDGTFVAASGNAGTLGDSTCHLVVTTTFPASGFAMIAREATGESMGYVVGQ